MKRIPLGCGRWALVDDADYGRLSRHSWYLHTTPTGKEYARTTLRIRGVWKNLSMHRMILGLRPGELCDHQNGNGLDNKRFNLRRASHQKNSRNMKPKFHSSRWKGVSWNTRRKKWVAQIQVALRKGLHLGYFNVERAAAVAYDEAALRYFGEYSRTNGLVNKRSQATASRLSPFKGDLAHGERGKQLV